MTCNVTQASHSELGDIFGSWVQGRDSRTGSHILQRLVLLAFAPTGKLSLFEPLMCFIKNIIKSKIYSCQRTFLLH